MTAHAPECSDIAPGHAPDCVGRYGFAEGDNKFDSSNCTCDGPSMPAQYVRVPVALVRQAKSIAYNDSHPDVGDALEACILSEVQR